METHFGNEDTPQGVCYRRVDADDVEFARSGGQPLDLDDEVLQSGREGV